MGAAGKGEGSQSLGRRRWWQFLLLEGNDHLAIPEPNSLEERCCGRRGTGVAGAAATAATAAAVAVAPATAAAELATSSSSGGVAAIGALAGRAVRRIVAPAGSSGGLGAATASLPLAVTVSAGSGHEAPTRSPLAMTAGSSWRGAAATASNQHTVP